MRVFKDGGPSVHGMPSITNQRALITAEVSEFEEVVPSGGGSIH